MTNGEGQARFDAARREAEIIRARLLELDPGGNYQLLTKRDLGLPESASIDDVFEAWRDYLAGRFQAITERQAFRDRLREPSLPDLDGVVVAITDDPASVAEVASENARQRVAEIQRTRENERQRLREARQS
jgi:hypothetical protein